jgi:hypothetical protein
MSHPLHYSVKPAVFVCSILYSSDGSIRVQQTVGTLHHVAISRLPLVLDVTSMRIVNSVVELVFRVSLQQTRAQRLKSVVQMSDDSVVAY